MQIEPVGSSFLGKPIYCVRVSGIPRSKEASYPALLAAGMMHAREMVSLSTHIYTIFRILYHARHQDPDVLDLLRRTNLYFVPMVNVDGVREISERHNRSLPLIRKNRHKNRVNCPKTEYRAGG